MGARGIERPVYAPKDTKLEFTWPMGLSKAQRQFILACALEECPAGHGCGTRGSQVVRWLERNAFLVYNEKFNPYRPKHRGA